MVDRSFPDGVLKLLANLNSVTVAGATEQGSLPFFVENKQVGLIRPDFWSYLKEYRDVFVVVESNKEKGKNGATSVHLSPDYKTYQERTSAVNGVLEDLRRKDVVLALRGWRHENYKLSQKFADKPLLEIERAGAGLFGFIQAGVHVNGYTRDHNGDIQLWIARRSKTKQTFPNMYDNMCAGGLAANLGVVECVKKECKEEASVSDEILERLKFVGTVSYFYEDERGLFPECQYIFDLDLPADFKPINADGEVGSFQRNSVDEVKDLMVGGNFTPTCAAVCLDFFIRHGLLDPDTDPNVSFYIEQLHAPLNSYYAGR